MTSGRPSRRMQAGLCISQGAHHPRERRNPQRFPVTAGAYDLSVAVTDAFACKFSPTGTRIYSTVIGGGDVDYGTGIVVGSQGNIYITGVTRGGFPIKSGYYNVYPNGPDNLFVARIAPNGTGINDLIMTTGLTSGSPGYNTIASSISLDWQGSIIIAGSTAYASIPTTDNAFQRRLSGFGSWDAFLVRFNAEGNQLKYCSYLGGNLEEDVLAMTISRAQDAILVGKTSTSSSPNLFPTTSSSYDRTFNGGSWDGFVAVLDTGTQDMPPAPGVPSITSPIIIAPDPYYFTNVNSVTVTFTSSDPEFDHFEVSTDNVNFVDDTGTIGEETFILTPGLKTIFVRAVNHALTHGTAASIDVFYDNLAPTASIDPISAWYATNPITISYGGFTIMSLASVTSRCSSIPRAPQDTMEHPQVATSP